MDTSGPSGFVAHLLQVLLLPLHLGRSTAEGPSDVRIWIRMADQSNQLCILMLQWTTSWINSWKLLTTTVLQLKSLTPAVFEPATPCASDPPALSGHCQALLLLQPALSIRESLEQFLAQI